MSCEDARPTTSPSWFSSCGGGRASGPARLVIEWSMVQDVTSSSKVTCRAGTLDLRWSHSAPRGILARLLGVAPNILAKALKLSRTADNMIERLLLPQLTAPCHMFVDGMGRERFPRLQDRLQSMCLMRLDQYMHMVWHYDPAVEFITTSVESCQSINNDLRAIRICQETGTGALVQPLLDSAREEHPKLMLFSYAVGYRMSPSPRLPLIA